MKLRTKYTLLTTILILVTVFSGSAVLMIMSKRYFYQLVKEREINNVRLFAQTIKNALINDDILSIINYAKMLKDNDKSIDYVFYVDQNNKIIAHTNAALIRETMSPSDYLQTDDSGKIFIRESGDISEYASSVMLGGEKKGTVQIGYLKKVIEEEINTNVARCRNPILVIAVVGMLIGILISYLISRQFTRGIEKLLYGVDTISQGNFDVKISLKSSDEIGQLANHFNQMADRLKELDRLKNEFVASVTHELRSPIAAIESYINDMQAGGIEQFKETGMDDLAVIKNNAMRLLRFVNDLLDTAKIESGKFELHKRSISINKTIKEVIKLYEPKANDQKIIIKSELESNLPNIIADEDRISQVLMNLLGNALKFSPEGGEIIVKTEKGAENSQLSNFIIVSVSDFGIGIPQSQQSLIFDKFTQAKGVRQIIKGPKGTGLGLYIAKSIVELHGGKIWVESPSRLTGRGATFFFALPC